MIRNYLTVAWRNLRKDLFYSILNILGIALASTIFLFIINFVRFENSYEDFHKRADHIYRLTLDLYQGSEYVVTDCETHPPLGPLLKKDFPGVIDFVRIQRMEEIPEVNYNNQFFAVEKIYAADPSVFSIFNYKLIEGNPSTVLKDPMHAVISKSQALRIFGTTDAKGKILRSGDLLFKISGVMEDSPANTHLKIDMMISFSSLEKIGWDLSSWNGNNNYTYVLLRPGTELSMFNKKLERLSKERLKNNIYTAEPIRDIHLHSHKTFEPEINGDAKTVQFLFITAILILLIGSANYINLVTARSFERTKEVGLRKILGSSRTELVKLFMVETVLINLTALVLLLVLTKLLSPFYLTLTGHSWISGLFSDRFFWTAAMLLFLFNCLLSGLYPAFTLSATKPRSVAGRTFTGQPGGAFLRKALVTGQFTVALVVLSASFIVVRQLSYLHKANLGLSTSEVMVITAPYNRETDSIQRLHTSAFKNSLLEIAGVQDVTASGALPGMSLHELSTISSLTRYGSDQGKGYNYYLYGIDADFFSTMGMQMAAGQNFRQGDSNKDKVIISEEAARRFGFKSAEAAVGERISLTMSKNAAYSTIIGVLKDYHQQSLKESLLPMIHWYTDRASFYSLKVDKRHLQKTIREVKDVFDDQFPEHPFEYHFLNELFDQQYKADQQFSKIVQVFSFFTLFITCMGLLGLAAYSISRRNKEIGIRKVLGASVVNILSTLSSDFMKLVLIAICIGTPLSAYIMHRWLENFAYHMELRWWMFLPAGLLTIAIAFISISFQSVKAALTNPARSLKSE